MIPGWAFCIAVGKASTCNAGDLGSIPVSGSSPGEGNGNPLQYSCLENSMERGAWQATIHGISRLSTICLFFLENFDSRCCVVRPKHTHTHNGSKESEKAPFRNWGSRGFPGGSEVKKKKKKRKEICLPMQRHEFDPALERSHMPWSN